MTLVRYTLTIFVLCRHERPHYARGWCQSCWTRWCNAGKPAAGPPPLLSTQQRNAARAANARLGTAARNARAEDRFGEYEWVRDADEIPESAGERVGVSRSTRFRYEARRRHRRALRGVTW